MTIPPSVYLNAAEKLESIFGKKTRWLSQQRPIRAFVESVWEARGEHDAAATRQAAERVREVARALDVQLPAEPYCFCADCIRCGCGMWERHHADVRDVTPAPAQGGEGCICGTPGTGNFEGPQRDCPVHGERSDAAPAALGSGQPATGETPDHPNAEDCPRCDPDHMSYPFICPGHPRPATGEERTDAV